MSPAKIAMAVAVTMTDTAGIGSMKNVTGTSSAVAIVAVRPGTAPTNSPNSAAATMADDVGQLERQPERLQPGVAHAMLRVPPRITRPPARSTPHGSGTCRSL